MYDATPTDDAYARYAPELADFVRARLADPEEAADLLQDVWTAYAFTLRTTPLDQPRAWLYRVARNRLTDHYRRRHSRPAFIDLTEDTEAASERTDPERLQQDIDAALTLLPPTQREVFVRNELDGETLREIAQDLGIPLKTAISRKGYARRRLQELLRDTYTDYFGAE